MTFHQTELLKSILFDILMALAGLLIAVVSGLVDLAFVTNNPSLSYAGVAAIPSFTLICGLIVAFMGLIDAIGKRNLLVKTFDQEKEAARKELAVRFTSEYHQ